MAKVGRPKQYRNDAEKQKAYRKRRALEKVQLEHEKFVIELIEFKIITLRKNVNYYLTKTPDVYIVVTHGIRNPLHHKVLVGGMSKGLVEDVVFQYLSMTAQIEFKKKVYGEDYYQLCDTEELDAT